MTAKYLTFTIDDETYAVPVLKVREIIKLLAITPVPQTPPHVRGVVNLRGKVIPVVDLRLKFGFDGRDLTDRTCIVVVDVALPAGALLMGVVVDAVSEVLSISAGEVEPTPEFGDRVDTGFITGIAKSRGRIIMLLDLDRVLSADGVVTLRAA
ncbi:MAG: chemotaxis protein CheW [Acidobacteriota bacterium]